MTARRLILIPLLIVALLSGCGGDGSSSKPGNPAVYKRISRLHSCGKLQAAFDQAMTNAEARQPGDPLREISEAYAQAAIDRQEAIGC